MWDICNYLQSHNAKILWTDESLLLALSLVVQCVYICIISLRIDTHEFESQYCDSGGKMIKWKVIEIIIKTSNLKRSLDVY